MLVYLNERPSAYLDEIVWFLWDEYDVVVSDSTVSRVIKQLGWSKKVVHSPSHNLRRYVP